MKKYTPRDIEAKWQETWAATSAYEAIDFSEQPKFVILTEFPYPSGAGLHLGHAREYTLGDIIARYKRARGYNVLYPMGFDAFGLPTENYAIKNKIAPQAATEQNIATFRKQFDQLGYSIDWSRSFSTTDPEYYKWTQWLFLKFYEHGLAYQAEVDINWCPFCKTGLANEEVQSGRHERCDTPVEKKKLKQWMLRITDYADRLIDGLSTVDFPSRIADQQINWIGKKTGINITYKVSNATKPNFVLLHGYTGSNEKTWFPWLKNKLEELGYQVQAPLLPHTDQPTEEEQVNFVLENLKFDQNTILVGHSLGGALALKVLEKLATPIRGLVLVAPGGLEKQFWTDDFSVDQRTGKEKKYLTGFSYNYDYATIAKNARQKLILGATNDVDYRKPWLEYLAEKIGASLTMTEATKYHFTGSEEPAIFDILPTTPTITVFTTRPDTNFGATFVVLAPEHPLVQRLIDGTIQLTNGEVATEAVAAYVKAASGKSDVERQAEGRKKTGVFTGLTVKNELSGAEMPVWISDFVLAGFGTGALVGVPGHDLRDFEFASEFDLPIIRVVVGQDGDDLPITRPKQVQEETGVMINSGFLDGLDIHTATE